MFLILIRLSCRIKFLLKVIAKYEWRRRRLTQSMQFEFASCSNFNTKGKVLLIALTGWSVGVGRSVLHGDRAGRRAATTSGRACSTWTGSSQSTSKSFPGYLPGADCLLYLMPARLTGWADDHARRKLQDQQAASRRTCAKGQVFDKGVVVRRPRLPQLRYGSSRPRASMAQHLARKNCSE